MANGDFNQQIVKGRVGQDPAAGTKEKPFSTFNVATDEGYTPKGKEKVEVTEWHKVFAYGKLADICNEHVKKGKGVTVTGSTKTIESEYEGKKTKEKVIIADKVLFNN